MSSKAAHLNDFGLVIAYVLPGFVAPWGTADIAPPLRAWLGTAPENAPTIAGFLFISVGAVAAGLTVSTVRWLVIDTLHHRTGIRAPQWDFASFERNVVAYGVLTEIHYRYYQFYANTLVALVWAYGVRRTTHGWTSSPFGWLDIGLFGLIVLFFLGSRDTLQKYYRRTSQLLTSRRTVKRK